MKKYLLRVTGVLSASLWLISACGLPSHTSTPKSPGMIPVTMDNTSDPIQEHEKMLRGIYLKGPSYQGNVDLAIRSAEHTLSLNPGNDFKTQADGSTVLYQETFTGTAESSTLERTLNQAKATKQYTLTLSHVDYEAENTHAQAEVKINGVTLVTLSASEAQVIHAKFSLRPDSQLQITLKNAENQKVKVNITEGGSTGAVIQKRTTPVPQQKSSEQAKAQLAQILASLPPSIGNKNQRFPEVQNATISMNGHPPENVAMGQFFISLNEPVAANLAAIQEAFNAVVIQGPIDEDTYLIAPDLTRIDIAQMEQDLKTLNARISDPYLLIQSVNFGDLESAKTLAFALQMSLDERVHSVGFNPLLAISSTDPDCSRPFKELLRDDPGVRTVEDVKVPLYLDLSGNLRGEYQKTSRLSGHTQWWTNKSSTWINHAWQYSTGYNREDEKRVRVAVIDQGFAGLSQLNAPEQEMTGRIRFNLGGLVVNDPEFLYNIGKSDAPDGEVLAWDFNTLTQEDEDFTNAVNKGEDIKASFFHGTQVASTIAAGINNGIGIAGVAPESEIVPIKVSASNDKKASIRQFDGSTRDITYTGKEITWSSVYTALKTAQVAGVDVVNISMNNRDVDFFLKGFFDNLSQKQWIRPMQRLIKDMSSQGVVIVASAGNFGWPAGFTLPGKRYFPEILVVGAIRQITQADTTGSIPITSTISANIYNDPEGTQVNSTRCVHATKIEGNVDVQVLSNYQTVRQVGTPSGDFWKTQLVGSNYGNSSDVDIWSPGANLLALGPQYSGTSYWIWEDTSAAAPVVAGTVALIKALRPDIHTQEVRQLLRRTATHSQDDTGLERSLPFPDLNLEVLNKNKPEQDPNATSCGTTQLSKKDYYNNCGTLQPTSTSIYTLNALKALEQLPGIAPSENKARVYYGLTIPVGQGYYQIQQKQNHVDGLIFPLDPDVREPGGFFSEDENFIDTFEDFINASPPRISTDTSTPQYYPVCINWQGLDSCIQHMQNWFENAYPPVYDTLYKTLTYNLPDRYIKVVGWPTPLGIRVLSLSLLNEEDVPEEERLYTGGTSPSSNPSGYPSSYPSSSPSDQPTPIPGFEAPLDFNAPVVASQVAGAGNTKAPYHADLRSVLKEGPFGSYTQRNEVNFLQHGPLPAAQWVGFLDPQQPIRQSYPKVPNTNKLYQSSEAFKLRILVQVKNQGQGGTLVVEAGGDERREKFGPGTTYENAELRPIHFEFFDSARESSGSLVKIHLIGGVENAQIIYKMFAIPYED